MEQIKIQKEFWDKIVSGEKKYEFRKLEKGITTGTYEFVSVDKSDVCGKCLNDVGIKGMPIMSNVCYCGHNVFGTAKLTPILVNTSTYSMEAMEDDSEWWYNTTNGSQTIIVGQSSYNFVKENYIDKNIDFVVYEISEVKEKDA